MATSNINNKNSMAVLLQNDAVNSLWVPSSSPARPGSASMVMSFDKAAGNDASFPESTEENENEEDYGGACFHAPSKKRRLTAKQVEYLEKSFETENKLEPERKAQMASEIGLQPRQVAIWFQNRRARYKTKQLEKDFSLLRSSFDSLKSDYDALLKHNHSLKLEINSLKEKMENGISSSWSVEEDQNKNDDAILACKQEDASSAKSDVLDSEESPHCAENNNYYLASEFSQDHEIHDIEDQEALILKRTIAFSPLPTFLPKIEDCCYDDPPGSSCVHLEFAVEDQPFNFWTY